MVNKTFKIRTVTASSTILRITNKLSGALKLGSVTIIVNFDAANAIIFAMTV